MPQLHKTATAVGGLLLLAGLVLEGIPPTAFYALKSRTPQVPTFAQRKKLRSNSIKIVENGTTQFQTAVAINRPVHKRTNPIAPSSSIICPKPIDCIEDGAICIEKFSQGYLGNHHMMVEGAMNEALARGICQVIVYPNKSVTPPNSSRIWSCIRLAISINLSILTNVGIY